MRFKYTTNISYEANGEVLPLVIHSPELLEKDMFVNVGVPFPTLFRVAGRNSRHLILLRVAAIECGICQKPTE